MLREYVANRATGTVWVERENFYRGAGGPLLLSLSLAQGPVQTTHYHVDHLGTPRLLTDVSGAAVGFHAYFPYGEEATDPAQDRIRYKFTGHERDLGDPTSTQDDLDHMHARMTNPQLGRFLSVDPVLQVGRAQRMPQLWNRYAYVAGNPIKYVDPTGEVFWLTGCAQGGSDNQCKGQKALLKSTLGTSVNQVRVNADGTVSLAKGVTGAQFAATGDFQKGLLKLIGDKSTFSLVTGTGRGAEQGGGEFVADEGGGGTIYLELGMFPKMTGDVMGTVQTALVHETAHALGTLFPEFYRRMNAALGRNFKTMLTEAYAVNFENRYRRAIGADIRGSYGGDYSDVVLDFDVDLFP